MQIHLSDDQALAFRLLALRLNIPTPDLVQWALSDFLARHSGG
jgi:hypothetical protein